MNWTQFNKRPLLVVLGSVFRIGNVFVFRLRQMTRRQKTRISYVIRDSYDSLQHRQGINTLAIDHESGLLYSGGRDTMVKKWDLNADQELNLRRNTVKDRNGSHQSSDKESLNKGKSESNQIQPLDTFDWHSDWVNDISIMKQSGHGREILISVLTCSNDRTILHWNPDNEERPALIGISA